MKILKPLKKILKKSWKSIPKNIRIALKTAWDKTPFTAYLVRMWRLLITPAFCYKKNSNADEHYAFWEAIEAIALVSIILFVVKFGLFEYIKVDVLEFVNPLLFSATFIFQGLIFSLFFACFAHFSRWLINKTVQVQIRPLFSKSFLQTLRGFSGFMVLFCAVGLLVMNRWFIHCQENTAINDAELWIGLALSLGLLFLPIWICCAPIYLELKQSIKKSFAFMMTAIIFFSAFWVYGKISLVTSSDAMLDFEAFKAAFQDSECVANYETSNQ